MKIALGSAQFGMDYGITSKVGKVSIGEINKIIRLAKDSAIDTIDTAIAYGDSEGVLGEVGVSGFKIVTKLPPIPSHCENIIQWTESQIKISLDRLRVDRVYGLLLHDPHQINGPFGTALIDALEGLKIQNVIEKIGISIYSPSDLDVLYEKMPFQIVQTPINVLDRRIIDSGWLVRLEADGVEVHARSVFLQGLLLVPTNEIPSKFMRWKNIWDTWSNFLSSSNLSALETCLSFVASLRGINKVIVGIESELQLMEILSATQYESKFDLPFELSNLDDDLINPVKWALKLNNDC